MKTDKLLFALAIMLSSALVVNAVSKKKIEKYVQKKTNWQLFDDNKYIFSTETTNIQYKEFLAYLKANDRMDEYNKYQVDTAQWREALASAEPLVNYYYQHSAYNDFPVVNVSHEAAQAYCKWLTELYNSSNIGFKHMFNKVEIRLPSREEWMKAAKAGKEDAMYPWGGPYCRNSKGQFLANFRAVPQEALIKKDSNMYELNREAMTFDGESFMITTPAKSYWPNSFGLYNMSGNVAEMLDEPGTSVGGSWKNTAYYMRLDVDADPYKGWDKPSPFIGFRPVMEVIEE